MTLDCTKLTSNSTTWLRNGSSGAQVTELQTILKKLGYYTKANGKELQIDGSFGSWTEKAVINFQSKTGNTKDGKVGPATCKSLNEKDNAVTVAKNSTDGFDCTKVNLKQNQSNDINLVMQLQTWLKDLGYYTTSSNGTELKIDGNYGTWTAEAVKKFQQTIPTLSDDGWFGSKTCPELNKAYKEYLAKKAAATSKADAKKVKKAEEIVIDATAANYLQDPKKANFIIEGVYMIHSAVEDTRSVESGDWQTVELLGNKTYTYLGHLQPREYDVTVYMREKEDYLKCRPALIQMTKKVCQCSGRDITAGKYVITWSYSRENKNWVKIVFHLLQYRG
jgi:peptidoglycan hydrolase-like protein with peptidoglycan-binding domain